MKARTAAWSLWALAMLGLGVVPLLDRLLRQAGRPDLDQLTPETVPPLLAVVVGATVGAVLVSRRPRHPVGWLLLAVALSLIATAAAAQYLVYGLLVRPGALPGARYAALYYPAIAFTALVLITFVLLLTPNGSLPSPGWRSWARAMAASPVVLLVVVTLAPKRFDPRYQAVGGPFDFRGFDGILLVANQVGFAVILAGVVIAAGSLAMRFQRARGVEREQLRWVAVGAALIALAVMIGLAGLAMDNPHVISWAAGVCLAILPLAIGAAILRYRLYDIDLIINRTLVYAFLTASLAATYAILIVVSHALVLGVDAIDERPDVVIAASTLAVAALFQPLRRRIQDFIDRRFYRRKYDAARTLDEFSARLRDELDLDALTVELVRAVRRTMQPAQVSLWVRTAPAPGKEGGRGLLRTTTLSNERASPEAYRRARHPS